MIHGADFASYQDDAAVTAALEHGLGFAFVKLTQGGSYINPRAVTQLDVLRAHGLRLGVYHYLDRTPSPAAQWEHFHRQLHRLDHHSELIVCLDYEQLGTTDVQARAFIAAGHAAGWKVGCYSSTATHAYTELGQAYRWVADWGKTPPDGWAFWQFAPGKDGGPDWDVFHGDRTRLAQFWHAHAGQHHPRRYHVTFAPTRRKPAVTLGPYKRLRQAAAVALAYALRHPGRRSYTVTRSGGA